MRMTKEETIAAVSVVEEAAEEVAVLVELHRVDSEAASFDLVVHGGIDKAMAVACEYHMEVAVACTSTAEVVAGAAAAAVAVDVAETDGEGDGGAARHCVQSIHHRHQSFVLLQRQRKEYCRSPLDSFRADPEDRQEVVAVVEQVASRSQMR